MLGDNSIRISTKDSLGGCRKLFFVVTLELHQYRVRHFANGRIPRHGVVLPHQCGQENGHAGTKVVKYHLAEIGIAKKLQRLFAHAAVIRRNASCQFPQQCSNHHHLDIIKCRSSSSISSKTVQCNVRVNFMQYQNNLWSIAGIGQNIWLNERFNGRRDPFGLALEQDCHALYQGFVVQFEEARLISPQDHAGRLVEWNELMKQQVSMRGRNGGTSLQYSQQDAQCHAHARGTGIFQSFGGGPVECRLDKAMPDGAQMATAEFSHVDGTHRIPFSQYVLEFHHMAFQFLQESFGCGLCLLILFESRVNGVGSGMRLLTKGACLMVNLLLEVRKRCHVMVERIQ